MTISISVEKAFYEIQYKFMIKTLRKLGIEGKFLLRSGRRQEFPILPVLFNIVLEFLASAKRQEKEIRGIQIRKDLSLFAEKLIFTFSLRNNFQCRVLPMQSLLILNTLGCFQLFWDIIVKCYILKTKMTLSYFTIYKCFVIYLEFHRKKWPRSIKIPKLLVIYIPNTKFIYR